MEQALSIGCTFSDRIEPLLDGRVAIEGAAHHLKIVEPQRLFRQVLHDQAYDIAELSMASHIAALAAGRRDYRAVPAFLSRSFRHSNLYVRTDRGIRSPTHLMGKRIGLVDFQQTAALWLRGLLADDYGVPRESVTWITGGLHTPVLHDRMPLALPPGLNVERSSETLDALLRMGAIDAVISPTAPHAFNDPASPVDRLWPDPRSAELLFWRKRQLFPIMHVLVVRRSLLVARPGLADAVFMAFDAARRIAAADLQARDFPKVMLPWLTSFAREAHDTLGADPWTYGMNANRGVLETMLRYAVADGLAPTSFIVDDIFA